MTGVVNLALTIDFGSVGVDWRTAFAFEIVGTIFLLWMMVMAYQVNRDDFD